MCSMEYPAAIAACEDAILEGRRLLARIRALTAPAPRPYRVRTLRQPQTLPQQASWPPPPAARQVLTAKEAAEVEAAWQAVAAAGRRLVKMQRLLLIWNPRVHFELASKEHSRGVECSGDMDAPFQVGRFPLGRLRRWRPFVKPPLVCCALLSGPLVDV